MSPRRKIDAPTPVPEASQEGGRRWIVPAAMASAVAVVAAALVASVMLFRSHSDYHRAQVSDVSVLTYVRQFMTQYTSPDPFNANGYADSIQAQATGEFAELFEARKTQTLVQVAMAQPTAGTVTEAGVEGWNDDGSANVIVVTTISTMSPDGTTPVESGVRWLVTVDKEGDQWKISRLREVL